MPRAKKPEPVPQPTPSRIAEKVGLPASWNTALAATVKLGVPAVIALWLVWTITSSMTMRLDRLVDDLNSHKTSTATMVEHLNENSRQSDSIIAVMVRVCLNTAKTDSDRLNCVVNR